MARPTRSCPECRAEVPAHEAGCPRCGHIFQAVEGVPAPVPAGAGGDRATAPPEGDASRGGSTGWKGVLAATLGCFALVIAAGAAFSWIVGRELGGLGAQFQRVRQEADLIALRAALEAWADDHDDRYPERLEQLTQRDGGGPWIESLPTDRWDRPFVFEPPPGGERSSGPGRLHTLGADGEPGGEGDDADLDEQALGLRRGRR